MGTKRKGLTKKEKLAKNGRTASVASMRAPLDHQFEKADPALLVIIGNNKKITKVKRKYYTNTQKKKQYEFK